MNNLNQKLKIQQLQLFRQRSPSRGRGSETRGDAPCVFTAASAPLPRQDEELEQPATPLFTANQGGAAANQPDSFRIRYTRSVNAKGVASPCVLLKDPQTIRAQTWSGSGKRPLGLRTKGPNVCRQFTSRQKNHFPQKKQFI